jgi:hypothetical protein
LGAFKKIGKVMGKIIKIFVSPEEIYLGQTLGRDSTQLNAEVLRVYKDKLNSSVEAQKYLGKIGNLSKNFDVHVLIALGKKLNIWREVGKAVNTPICETVFRQSNDFGYPSIKISSKWYVWKLNRAMRFVGDLDAANRTAEIGCIWTPPSVIHRIKTGVPDFFYPD